MNLVKEFEKIINKYGRDVLVVRQKEKLYCSCYDEVNKEARRDCPLCFGLGWGCVAEKHRTRAQDSSLPETLVRLIKGASIGGVKASGRQYYFKPDMLAEEEDLIVEVDWDRFGRPSYNGGGIWSINSVDRNMHLEQDVQVYRKYYASEESVRSKVRGINITENNGIKKYNVMIGG